MEQEIYEALKEVRDPEIPIDIVTRQFFAEHIRRKILEKFPVLKNVVVEFVFEPPWTKEKISEEGKAHLRRLGWDI